VQAAISGIAKSTEDSYNTLLAELTRQNVPVLLASAGWRVETGDGLIWEILAPGSDSETPQTMVLRLKYGEAVFLFTNQLTHRDEELLMQQPHLVQANVYQAADHAADDSNSEAWIAAVNPQVVIVQNDPSHREAGAIGHVMAHFEGRKLFRTDRNGTIEITTEGRTLKIQSALE
jgi:competence protein ComEC